MTMRVGCYARFSTDLQNDKSNADQHRLCQQAVERLMPHCGPIRNFEDAAQSGASMFGRPGLQALLRAIEAGEIDLVITEHLDRLSRRLADAADIYDRLKFAKVRLITVSHGEVDEMKIAFMGLQSEMFLKNVAEKTHRGLSAKVERGLSAGGISYGYRTVTDQPGVLQVDPAEAATVRRILQSFVAGVSPKAIAKTLNLEGIPGPAGGAWSPSTIHGNPKRGTGVVNNALYIGRLVWNRQSFAKDPKTGKRVARLNPPTAWMTKEVPHLRIVEHELWQAVKERQAASRKQLRNGIVGVRRPLYLFSKLTRCATCNGGFILSSRDTLRCFNNTARGTCTNSRKITRQDLENRVLRALREDLLQREPFAEFCRTFTDEMNRLRRAHRIKLAAAPREIAGLKRRSQEILKLLLEGFRNEEWKEELRRLDARRVELEAVVAAADTEPALPALHPAMADVFRRKTEQLAAALEHGNEELRQQAREALRGYLDRIVIPPGDGLLSVVGNFGEMLTAAGGQSGAAAVGYVGCGGGI